MPAPAPLLDASKYYSSFDFTQHQHQRIQQHHQQQHHHHLNRPFSFTQGVHCSVIPEMAEAEFLGRISFCSVLQSNTNIKTQKFSPQITLKNHTKNCMYIISVTSDETDDWLSAVMCCRFPSNSSSTFGHAEKSQFGGEFVFEAAEASDESGKISSAAPGSILEWRFFIGYSKGIRGTFASTAASSITGNSRYWNHYIMNWSVIFLSVIWWWVGRHEILQVAAPSTSATAAATTTTSGESRRRDPSVATSRTRSLFTQKPKKGSFNGDSQRTNLRSRGSFTA